MNQENSDLLETVFILRTFKALQTIHLLGSKMLLVLELIVLKIFIGIQMSNLVKEMGDLSHTLQTVNSNLSAFSRSERNYCVTRKELLAVVTAIKDFHHYLNGRKFTIHTDHARLKNS